jgi:hypothetical protein
MLAKLIALLAPVTAFVVDNKALIAPAAAGVGLFILALAAVYLPTAHMRSVAVLLVALFSFIAGVFISKELPLP